MFKFRVIDFPVIDIGDWFVREFNVEEISIGLNNNTIECIQKPFNRLLRVRKLLICLNAEGHGCNASEIREAVDEVVSCFGAVQSVVLEVFRWSLEKRGELIDTLKLSSNLEKVSVVVELNGPSFSTDSFNDYLEETNTIQLDPDLVDRTNWSIVEDLHVHIDCLEQLQQIEFASLRSLKILIVSAGSRKNVAIDWGVLDPIRDNLERVSFYLPDCHCVSQKTFDGMSQLKYLRLSILSYGPNGRAIILNQLDQLKELHLELSACIDVNVNLQSLESLCLVLQDKPGNRNSEMNFELPRLVDLELDLAGLERTVFDISDLANQIPGVKTLKFSPSRMSTSGELREFKSLRKLWIFSPQREMNSQMLIGLEHLVELTLETAFTTPGALSKLKRLEAVKVRSREDEWIKGVFNPNLFEGLESLKEIVIEDRRVEQNDYQPNSTVSFMYIEQLRKFVLVTHYQADESEEAYSDEE